MIVDDFRIQSLSRLSIAVSPGYILNVICDHVSQDLPSDASFNANHNQLVLERLHPIHAGCDNLCKVLAAKFCMVALPELDDILTDTGEATGIVRGLKELVTCSQFFTVDLVTTFCFARTAFFWTIFLGNFSRISQLCLLPDMRRVMYSNLVPMLIGLRSVLVIRCDARSMSSGASYCDPKHLGSLNGKPKLMRSTEYGHLDTIFWD